MSENAWGNPAISWSGDQSNRVTADQVKAEMQNIVRSAAQDSNTVLRGIEVAAKRLGLGYERAFAIYYGRAQMIGAHEWINALAWQEQNAQRRSRTKQKHILDELDRLDAELTARIAATRQRLRPPRSHKAASVLDCAGQPATRLKGA